ncbi:MAG: glutaminyl-peptide cyclotransferase [Pseudomonadota bacterium]
MSRYILASLFALAACAKSAPAESEPPQVETQDANAETGEPRLLEYEVVETYPHDPAAFTQGLFVHDGKLYESTGRYRTSSLRQVNLETGDPVQVRNLPARYFGEGATPIGDKIVMVTWRSQTGFVFDLKTFKPLKSFTYSGEGWGLTDNDEKLFLSDGSPVIRIMDPDTLQKTGDFTVTYGGRPLARLNELEWIDGLIWANVWQSDRIMMIDPASGRVVSQIDLTGLFPAEARNAPQDDVLNGIAYDADSGRIFVTGKNWPNLFEIRLVDPQ